MSQFSCETCLTPSEKEWSPYSIVRILGWIVLVLGFVNVVMIGLYGFSNQSKSNIAFHTNTFLESYKKGPLEYTWQSWDAFANTTMFLQCTENARIFTTSCEDGNETSYESCISKKFPRFYGCINRVQTSEPYFSSSELYMNCLKLVSSRDSWNIGINQFQDNLVDFSKFQEEIVYNCLLPDQKPIVTVLQDKNSWWYLGNYNSALVLWTAVWIMCSFIVYTAYIPSALTRQPGEYTDSRIPKIKLNSADTWARTGYVITWIVVIWNALFVIILLTTVFRQKSAGDMKGFYEMNIGMSITTSVICSIFIVFVCYYFAIELWEKQYITEVNSEYVKMQSKGSRLNLVFNTMTEWPKNQTQLPILLFPWAESAVFVDALILLGLIGLQIDNNTLEVTLMFQAIMYSSVIGVSYVYDLYEKIQYDKNSDDPARKLKEEDRLPNDEPYIMSFCTNTASTLLWIIPLFLFIKRFTYSSSGSLQIIILMYMIFMFILHFLKWIWHMTKLRVFPLGWAELFWILKWTIQLVFVLTAVLIANSEYDKNNSLRTNIQTWYINL